MRRGAAACLVVLSLAGCERAMRDMYDQPRYRRMEAAPERPGNASVRALPEHSVARAKGETASASSGTLGAAAVVEADRVAGAQTNPLRVDWALLARGRERYTIYCAPCHSPVGDGEGVVASRGFPHPPSYHSERLRSAPDRHYYDVVTEGYGIMYSYADRVAPADRWAIIAYIRALQLSQHAEVAALPPAMRARLDAAKGAERR